MIWLALALSIVIVCGSMSLGGHAEGSAAALAVVFLWIIGGGLYLALAP